MENENKSMLKKSIEKDIIYFMCALMTLNVTMDKVSPEILEQDKIKIIIEQISEGQAKPNIKQRRRNAAGKMCKMMIKCLGGIIRKECSYYLWPLTHIQIRRGSDN